MKCTREVERVFGFLEPYALEVRISPRTTREEVAEWQWLASATASYMPNANEVREKLNPETEQTPRNQGGQ